MPGKAATPEAEVSSLFDFNSRDSSPAPSNYHLPVIEPVASPNRELPIARPVVPAAVPLSVRLKCSNCRRELEVSPDMVEFACGYCGAQCHAVRHGGTVSLKSAGGAIASVQRGTDRTAAELAVLRLKSDLSDVGASLDRLNDWKQKSIQSIENPEGAKGLFATFLLTAAVLYCSGNAAYLTICVVGFFLFFGLLFYVQESRKNGIRQSYEKQCRPLIDRKNQIESEIASYMTLIHQTKI